MITVYFITFTVLIVEFIMPLNQFTLLIIIYDYHLQCFGFVCMLENAEILKRMQ